MPSSDLAAFRADLVKARDFLVKMRVREAALAISGPNALADWDEYADSIAALGALELHLTRATAWSKEIAPELQDKFKGFAEKSPLALRAAEIAVSVRIADARRLDGQFLVLARKTASIFSLFKGGGIIKSLFSKKSELPVKEMLVDIERLLPLVTALEAAAAKAAP